MKKIYKVLSLAALSLMMSVSLFAQAPANDLCANATDLTVSPDTTCNPTSASLDNANDELGAEACGQYTSTLANDVWFKFTATSTHHIISANSADVGLVSVLYGTCGGAAIACANPQIFFGGAFVLPGTTTVDASGLTIGNVYLVRIYAFSDTIPVTAGFDICVTTPPAPPANDICANAISLSVSATCVPTMGTVLSATEESVADSCAGASTSVMAADVWYKFTAAATSQTVTVSSSTVAAEVVLYDGCGGTSIACKNPQNFGGQGFPGTTTLKATGLAVGTTYFVRIYNYGDKTLSNGDFTICVTTPPAPPANDECAGAIAIPVANNKAACTTTTTVNTVGATQGAAFASCSPTSSDDDVWYSFIANDTGMVVMASNYTGGITRFGLSLYEGSCTGTESNCRSNSGTGDSIALHNLIIGTTYYLEIFSNGANFTGTFDICVYSALGVASGVDNVSAIGNSLTVQPNPAKDRLNVSFNTASRATISLVSVSGQVVYSENAASMTGRYEKSVDLSNMSQGIYMLQIVTDKETITRKVVKE